ncbi:MAG: sigma 54-interacting transcriptional regulator [Desulforhabdus sp.]|jgi:transcriptional regulator with GAF, ATPase, and Fis domain|nr:sigma 54-interacting transcriptional regulator [Desulforhabdus sp.]
MAEKNRSEGRRANYNREAEELRVLLEISQTVMEYLCLDDLIYYVIKRVQELIDAEGVSIILPDESGGEFLICWTENIDIQYKRKLKEFRFPLNKGIAGRVFKNRKPELIPDTLRDAHHYKRVDDFTGFRTKSMIAAPLQGRRDVIGVLEVVNKRIGTFDDKDLDFLTTLSCIVGLALDNARMYGTLDRAYQELQVIDKAKDNLLELAKEENIRLRREIEGRYRFDLIKGNSDSMLAILQLCEKAIESDITVLIKGETGTGKELIARCIHYNGRRKDKLFLTQNCGALPETLLASELFGYRKGAFTGAYKDKKGLFEIAHGGTVFLDEVGEMSAMMQASLLRVLQEGEIKPLGAELPKNVDVRIISATNRSLEDDVKNGRFREDLYYRLSVFPIDLPPLRERSGDIPVLAMHFVKEFNKKNNQAIRGISPKALQTITRYPFPGNVRELQNEIERAMAMAQNRSQIELEHLSDKLRTACVATCPTS